MEAILGIINQSVPRALTVLTWVYSKDKVADIIALLRGTHGTLRGAPHINPETLEGQRLHRRNVGEDRHSNFLAAFEIEIRCSTIGPTRRSFCTKVLRIYRGTVSAIPDFEMLKALGLYRQIR